MEYSLAGLILVGVLTGLMPGLFGYGGGWLLVPVLVTAVGVPWSMASGTVLCAILAGSSSGVAGQWIRRRTRPPKRGHLEPPLEGAAGVVLVVSALFGTTVGKAVLRDRLASHPAMTVVLDAVLIATLLLIASRLVYEVVVRHRRGIPIEPGTLRLSLLALGGFFPGVLSGLIGIGGGILYVPVLLLLLRWREDDARTLSRAAVLGTAVVGTLLYASDGGVDLAVAACMFLPAGVIGVTAARFRFSHNQRRRTVFKLLTASLAAVAIALAAMDMFRQAPSQAPDGRGSLPLVLVALCAPLFWGIACALVHHVLERRRPTETDEDLHAGWFYQI